MSMKGYCTNDRTSTKVVTCQHDMIPTWIISEHLSNCHMHQEKERELAQITQ